MDKEEKNHSAFSGFLSSIKSRVKKITRNEIFFFFSSWFIVACLLGLAYFLQKFNFDEIVIDTIRQLAVFLFSISTVDSFKEFILKKQTEQEKKDLLQETTSIVKNIIDGDKKISASGLLLVSEEFPSSQIKSIIKKLKPGDKLYCHVGFISGFDDLRSLIIEKALLGVHFHFLVLAPYCKNAYRRAKEVGEESDIYSGSCRQFINTLNSIDKEIKKRKGDATENVQVRRLFSP